MVEQYVTKVMAIAGYVCLLAHGRLAFVGEAPEVAEMDLASAYLGAGTARL